MTGKVFQSRTIGIRAEKLKKTMTRIVFQLIYFHLKDRVFGHY